MRKDSDQALRLKYALLWQKDILTSGLGALILTENKGPRFHLFLSQSEDTCFKVYRGHQGPYFSRKKLSNTH